MNQVNRSRYGQRLAQNATREIGRARNFAAATGTLSDWAQSLVCVDFFVLVVDQAQKQQVEQRLHEAQNELAMQGERMKELEAEENKRREEHRKVKAEKACVH